MRRLALVVAVAAAACRPTVPSHDPGPLDAFFYPTGLAVLPASPTATRSDQRLVVVSSNADLTYDEETVGSVISVDPEPPPTATAPAPIPVTGAMNIKSFAGEIALLDPGACPALAGAGAAAFVPVRGQDVIYRLAVGADGSLACDPSGCTIAVGTTDHGDPWSAGVACDGATAPGGPQLARAFVGYLRQASGVAWLTQIDLTKAPGADGYVQFSGFEYGQIRGMAYDDGRRRLYLTHTVLGASTTLMWYDLGGGCRIDVAQADGGCVRGETPDPQLHTIGAVPYGVELHGIALAHQTDPTSPVRRAYVTGRIYDPVATGQSGGRVGDFDGLLLVVDLTESATGVLEFDVVNEIPIGYGASDVRVLPARPGKRDVVAALASDDGVVWIYDDDTGAAVPIGRSPATGAPLVGHVPFGLAVDPAVLPGTNTARVYVGSFQESFVTPIDVPLDDPEAAAIAVDAKGAPRRITGGNP